MPRGKAPLPRTRAVALLSERRWPALMLDGAVGAIAVQLAGVTSVFYERFVIGTRSDCDLVLYDQDASPLHAMVAPEEVGWQIEDMGARQGVRVNGRLCATALLGKGDRIRLGSTTLVVVPI